MAQAILGPRGLSPLELQEATPLVLLAWVQGIPPLLGGLLGDSPLPLGGILLPLGVHLGDTRLPLGDTPLLLGDIPLLPLGDIPQRLLQEV